MSITYLLSDFISRLSRESSGVILELAWGLGSNPVMHFVNEYYK